MDNIFNKKRYSHDVTDEERKEKKDTLTNSRNKTIELQNKIKENDEKLSFDIQHNISHNHELDMLNNNDHLLTDDLAWTTREQVQINQRLNNNKKKKKNHAMINSALSSRQLVHTDSSYLYNNNSMLEGMRTNKAFHMIRAKRMEQSLNSSLDISIGDIGGRHCCGRLKKNYDVDLSLTSQRSLHYHNGANIEYYHERSSSLPTKDSTSKSRKNKDYSHILEEKITEEKYIEEDNNNHNPLFKKSDKSVDKGSYKNEFIRLKYSHVFIIYITFRFNQDI